MALPLYLAMTAFEISAAPVLPERFAYMACHFSPYTPGLSNIPQSMPENSMLILNDSTPVGEHDPALIAAQLKLLVEQQGCSRVLLDLQRPPEQAAMEIAACVVSSLSCPVGVSEGYAKALSCPVFLSSPPMVRALKEHLLPWEGREIWLEAAMDTQIITVDESGSYDDQGCVCTPSALPHQESRLHCHYRIEPYADRVQFTLQRTPEDLNALLEEAERLGVVCSVGLYQELAPVLSQLSDLS